LKLIGNRTRWRRQLGNDALPAQQRQQRHERPMGLAWVPHYARWATTVRQVIVQKLIDTALVESAC
jgi:hypothetical protein